ncbi:MAG: PhoH family protein [Gammaproteobacteria bacterium]|nr:PhoH family protein [Gammaproteobacteria bacterium]
MDDNLTALDLALEPTDNQRLARLCGQFDEHLRQLEGALGVEINRRGERFRIIGDAAAIKKAEQVIIELYRTVEHENIGPGHIPLALKELEVAAPAGDSTSVEALSINTRSGRIRARGPTQKRYLQSILTHDISFGVGPAGTGKTYLAVACAVEALNKNEVQRILLTRPAVEAGERLGFLPGDLAQKIDPYLRPLYDALYEMLGFERVAKMMERNIIEVAPLAYMRGRTLNDSFIILDEAQNATAEQMKMFLTRMGYGSRMVVTGDITQIDLPRGVTSGLRQIIEVLKNVEGISFTFFQSRDVVRHPLVQLIVAAYDDFDQARE